MMVGVLWALARAIAALPGAIYNTLAKLGALTKHLIFTGWLGKKEKEGDQ